MVSKDSAVYRGIKTALQILAALIVYALADENVRSLLQNHPQILALLAVLGGVISVIQNVLDPNIPNV